MNRSTPKPLIAVVYIKPHDDLPYLVAVYTMQSDGTPRFSGYQWLHASFKDYPEAVGYAAEFNKREPKEQK